MNITQAKQIALARIVEALGGRFSHETRKGELWYFSPFRPNEKTASFKIDEARNSWYDFGSTGGPHNGGDGIDLWCDINRLDRKSGVKAALSALERLSILPGHPAQVQEQSTAALVQPMADEHRPSRYKILKLHSQIWMPALLDEISRRHISRQTANNYLKQVYLQDSVYPERKLNGFAFRNDKGGLEISCPNPKKGTSFKTSTRPKAPTTFSAPGSNILFVFEGFWDFLSCLEINDTPKPEYNVAVLNSLSFCGEIVQQIIAAKNQLGTIALFLDNDDAGCKATQFMAAELNNARINVKLMQGFYQNFKDLSDYWAKDAAAQKFITQQQGARAYYTENNFTALRL